MLTLDEAREAIGDDEAFGRWLQGRGIWRCEPQRPSELCGYIMSPMQVIWEPRENAYRVVGYMTHPHDDEWYTVRVVMHLCVDCDLMDLLGDMA